MIKKIEHNQITWIDIHKPEQKDLDELKENFKLHPLIVKQFLPPLHRPQIEEYPNQLFMVLHFPVYYEEKKETKPVEIDFILFNNTLITSHNKKVPALEVFLNDCQVQKYYQQRCFTSSGHLLFNLLDWLIDSCLPMLDHMTEKADQIEKEVFQGKEKEMLSEIAILKKDLIDFRRAIKPQRSVLEILEKKAKRLFGKEITPLSQEVIGSIIRVWNTLENNKELITSIEQTNNSLLSYKLSDIMKFLTVVSFITFPLSVIVGFFGMNMFANIPLISQNNYAWIYILALMIITTLIMVIYFKKKKWL